MFPKLRDAADAGARAQEPAEIKARRFTLVDAEGKALAVLDAEGGMTWLDLNGADGEARVRLAAIRKDNQAFIMLKTGQGKATMSTDPDKAIILARGAQESESVIIATPDGPGVVLL